MVHPAAPSRAYMTKKLLVGFVPISLRFMAGAENVKIVREQFLQQRLELLGEPILDEDGKEQTVLTKVGRAQATLIREKSRTSPAIYGRIIDHPEEIVHLVETAHGKVELSDDEMDRLLAPGGDEKVAELLAIHPTELYDDGPYMTSGLLYQVRPEKGSEKPFMLFLNALKKDWSFALIRYVNRGSQYLGALFPDGYLYGVRYDDEVREVSDIPAVNFSENEMVLMQTLVDEMKNATPLALEHPHNKVRAYAEAKAGDGAPELVVATTAPIMIDLTKAIAESIASIQAAKAKAAV